MQFIPNTAFEFLKEQFGELILYHEKEEIKQVEIKSKNIFEGNMLTKIEYNLNL